MMRVRYARQLTLADKDLLSASEEGFQLHQWRLNGPGITSIDLTAGQPLYWDQLHVLYKRHIVHSARIKIQINSGGGSAGTLLSSFETVYWTLQVHRESETRVLKINQLLQMPYAQVIQRQESGGSANPIVFDRYVNMKKFFGTEIEDSTHSGAAAVVPGTAYSCIATLSGYSPSLAAGAIGSKIINIVADIEFWVEFYHRVEVTES